jgi:hypothetical protein
MKSKVKKAAPRGLTFKNEQDVAGKYGIAGRLFIGSNYDDDEIDAATYAGVRWKPKGYYLDWSRSEGDALDGPPEGHVENTPHGRSILQRRVILKPVETIQVGDRMLIIDGLDRWYLHVKHGIPCPIEVVEGLRMEDVADYIVEINSARGRPTFEERKAQVRHYLETEEARFVVGEIDRRSAYNKVALICDVAHSTVKKIERDYFPTTRWADACKGEERDSLNGKKFRVREEDPERKIAGLSSKLAPDANTTRSERETSIRLIRDILKRYKDLLSQQYIKKIEGDAQMAEALQKVQRDEESRSRTRAEEQASLDPEKVVRKQRVKAVSKATPNWEPDEPLGEPEERDGYLRERYRKEDDLFEEMNAELPTGEPDEIEEEELSVVDRLEKVVELLASIGTISTADETLQFAYVQDQVERLKGFQS